MDKKISQSRHKNQRSAIFNPDSEEYIQRSIKNNHSLIRQFNDELSPELISKFWDNFRYSENKNNGNIAFDHFSKTMSQVFHPRFSDLYDIIFYRFTITSNDHINIYDLLISLSVFMKRDQKIKLNVLMKLMDVDEDNCMSILELKNLIYKLEELFIMFQYQFKAASRPELKVISDSLAQEKFNYLTNYKYQYEKDLKVLSQILMPYNELFEVLGTKKSYWNDFLPSNVFFEEFLQFRYKDISVGISSKDFIKFGYEINKRVSTKIFKSILSSMISSCNYANNNSMAKKDTLVPNIESDFRTSTLTSDIKKNNSQKFLQLPQIKTSKMKSSMIASIKKSPPLKKEPEENPNSRSQIFEERRKMIKVLKIGTQLPNHIPVSKIINGL